MILHGQPNCILRNCSINEILRISSYQLISSCFQLVSESLSTLIQQPAQNLDFICVTILAMLLYMAYILCSHLTRELLARPVVNYSN